MSKKKESSKKPESKKMDERELQERSERLVRNEVNHVLTLLAEKCFEKGIFNYEDVQNYYSYPEYIGDYAKFYGGTEEARDKEVKRLEEVFGKFESEENTDAAETVRAEIEQLERLESEPQEIFEWWIISDWLKDELLKHGEPVLEADEYGLNLWGRGTSGQAISMDGVIRKITRELHEEVSKMEKGGAAGIDEEMLDDIAYDLGVEHQWIDTATGKWKSEGDKDKAYKLASVEMKRYEKGGKIKDKKQSDGINWLITGE